MQNKVAKRNNGRVGKGHGQSVVNTIRRAFDVAIADLDARGTPLPELMANALQTDTLQALNTIARFMPRDVDVNIGGGNFADALAQAADIMRSDNAKPVVIDIEPEEKEKGKDNKGLDD